MVRIDDRVVVRIDQSSVFVEPGIVVGKDIETSRIPARRIEVATERVEHEEHLFLLCSILHEHLLDRIDKHAVEAPLVEARQFRFPGIAVDRARERIPLLGGKPVRVKARFAKDGHNRFLARRSLLVIDGPARQDERNGPPRHRCLRNHVAKDGEVRQLG